MPKPFLLIFYRSWLPLFLLLSLSWLFGPWYYHNHYGTLQLISTYEAGARAYSWLFRVFDMLAALLLIGGVAAAGLLRRRQHWFGWLLLVIGVLSAVDGFFPDGCSVGLICSNWQALTSSVHDVETLLLAVVVAVAAGIHSWRSRQWPSQAFVAVQVGLALLALSGLLSSQGVIVLQYIYEVALVSWLGWLVSGYFPAAAHRPVIGIRRAFGIWTLVSGALAIVAAAPHLHLYRPLYDASLTHSSALVSQHGVIVGVLMLYLARQVYQGQRRAAGILLLIFASNVIKYSVLAPQPALLGISLLSFVLLLYGRRAFDFNTYPLPFLSRLKDALVVLSGVVLALLLSYVLISASGHRHQFDGILGRSIQEPAAVARNREERLSEHAEQRLRIVLETLGISTLALVAWSLFRPARILPRRLQTAPSEVQALLERYSNNSEDYFKLWPKDKAYYQDVHHNGFVAYRQIGASVFALADPITVPPQRAALLESFIRHCRAHGWSVCFLPVSAGQRTLYEQHLRTLQIGSSSIIDIAQFCRETSREKWWRWQRNRAEKGGMRYQTALPPHSPALLGELRGVSDAWLERGGRSEQGFALGYFANSYLQQCRLHLLRAENGDVLAFTNELPIFGKNTQRTVDLLRFKPDHDGSMPYLLLRMIEFWYDEGQARTFDLGFVPLAGVDSNLAQVVRWLGRGRFSAAGLEQFKNKFRPDWQPNYIAYDGDLLDLARFAAGLEHVFKK